MAKRNKFEKLGKNDSYFENHPEETQGKKENGGLWHRVGKKTAEGVFGSTPENVPEKERVPSRFTFTRSKQKVMYTDEPEIEIPKPDKAPFILVLVCMALLLLGSALLTSDLMAGISSTGATLAVVGVSVAAYVIPVIVYILSSKSRMKFYNIKGFSASSVPIIAASLGVLLCAVALQKYFIAYTFSYSVPVVTSSQGVGIALVVSALVPALCEELLIRGVVQYEITKYAGGISGVVAGALLFGFIHFDLQYFMIYFTSGIILGLLTHITHSVFPAMIVHFLNNTFSVLLSDRLAFVATERIGGSFLMIVLAVFGFVVLLILLQMIEKLCAKRAVTYAARKEENAENDEAYYFVAKDKGTLSRFGKVLVSPYMLACLGLFAVVVICKLNF